LENLAVYLWGIWAGGPPSLGGNAGTLLGGGGIGTTRMVKVHLSWGEIRGI